MVSLNLFLFALIREVGAPAVLEFVSHHPLLSSPPKKDVTLFTSDISLPVLYQNYEVGRAIIPDLGLIPGTNVIDTLVRYMPADANSTVAQDLLTKYLQPPGGTTGTQDASVVIDGSSKANPAALSPYDSINPALEGVTIRAVLNGIGTRIVDSVAVFIDLTQICA